MYEQWVLVRSGTNRHELTEKYIMRLDFGYESRESLIDRTVWRAQSAERFCVPTSQVGVSGASTVGSWCRARTRGQYPVTDFSNGAGRGGPPRGGAARRAPRECGSRTEPRRLAAQLGDPWETIGRLHERRCLWLDALQNADRMGYAQQLARLSAAGDVVCTDRGGA